MIAATSDLENLGGCTTKDALRTIRDGVQQILHGLNAIIGHSAGATAVPLARLDDSPTLLEVVNEMLNVKARNLISDSYLWQLRHCFSLFARGRSRRPLGSIQVREMEKWLDSAELSPRTVRGRIQYIRALYKFAQRRGYVQRNPALALELPREEPKEPGESIHTPDQVKAILAAALAQDPGTAKALAIRYFAGLRSAELERLDVEKEINLERRRIEITAAKSKTRRRRFITIQPNLSAWLALEADIPGDLEKRITLVWQKAGVRWPRNVTRHSFCSYHLAEFQNAAKTALQAGHSEQMLFSHYHDLLTPEAATEYWAIVPQG